MSDYQEGAEKEDTGSEYCLSKRCVWVCELLLPSSMQLWWLKSYLLISLIFLRREELVLSTCAAGPWHPPLYDTPRCDSPHAIWPRRRPLFNIVRCAPVCAARAWPPFAATAERCFNAWPCLDLSLVELHPDQLVLSAQLSNLSQNFIWRELWAERVRGHWLQRGGGHTGEWQTADTGRWAMTLDVLTEMQDICGAKQLM